MKNKKKRILALCLSMLLLLEVSVWANDENETAQEMQIVQTEKTVPKVIEMEAGFLSAMGMLPDDVDFDAEMTREEAAVLLCKMLAREDLAKSYSNVSYYEDVSVYSPNVGYINVVTNEGLFSGRSERIFAPKDAITYAELSKLLVTSVGYSIAAERKGGYPDGYLGIASQLKIVSNISYSGNSPVKWGDAVKMVYETMYVDVLSSDSYYKTGDVSVEKTEGQNILTIYHKLFWDKGQITATPRSKLYGMGPSEELDIGEIEIDGILYTYDTEKLTYLDDLTGYNVEYYYRENTIGRLEIVYVYLKNNDTISVISTDIEEVYGFDVGDNGSAYLKYLDEDTMKKSERLPLDKELSLIVNDNTMPHITNQDLFPDCGSVTLIDSDNDGKYDVAKVLDYDMRIVDVVSIYDKHIFFKDTHGDPKDHIVPLVLNPTYRDIYYDITCDGEVISLNQLHEDDVVGIIESTKKDFVYYRIELLSTCIEGTVEAYGDNEIDIDGKTYKVSPTFDFIACGIELGERYKLYFDFADRLLHAEIIDESIPFEYVLIAAGMDGRGINKKAQIKVCYSPIYTGKKVQIFDLAERVKINGKRCSANEALEQLKLKDADKKVVGYDYLQPLRYVEFNDAGEVSMIETVEGGISDKYPGKKYRTFVGTGPYNEGFNESVVNEETGDRETKNIPITYETHMFYIPKSMLDDDWYYSELTQIRFGSGYTTLMWGEVVDETDPTITYPECVFLYHDRTSVSGSSANSLYDIDYTLPMLVSKKTMVYDAKSGDYLPKLETYNSGGRFTYSADSRNSNRACFDNLKVGDVIFPALTNTLTKDNVGRRDKEIPEGKLWSVDKLLSLSDRELYYYSETDNFYGRVQTIRTNPRLNKCVVNAFVGETELRPVSLTGVPIYYYDRGENTISLATYAAIKPAEIYGEQDASRIFVFFDETDNDENVDGLFKAIMAVIVGEK